MASWLSRLPPAGRVAGFGLKAMAAVVLVTGALEWKRRQPSERPASGRVATAAAPPLPSPRPAAPPAGLDTRALGSLSAEAAKPAAATRRP